MSERAGARFLAVIDDFLLLWTHIDIHTMNERKLYLGIPLSGKLSTRLAQGISKWGSLPMFPTRPENLFVTVLFLGFVTDEHAVEIAEKAEAVCAEFEPFDLMFDTIELAPAEGPTKMIQLVGEESPQLLALRNALERDLAGKKVDGKRFRPRVTLAQVKRAEFPLLPEEKLAMFPQTVSLAEPVSSILLLESIGAGAKRQYLSMDAR